MSLIKLPREAGGEHPGSLGLVTLTAVAHGAWRPLHTLSSVNPMVVLSEVADMPFTPPKIPLS